MGWNRVMPEVMRSFFADFRAWPRKLFALGCRAASDDAVMARQGMFSTRGIRFSDLRRIPELQVGALHIAYVLFMLAASLLAAQVASGAAQGSSRHGGWLLSLVLLGWQIFTTLGVLAWAKRIDHLQA
jgi:hypothetical protein